MAESLELFDSIINSRWFLRTSIILFMNKIDVFRNKLPKARALSLFRTPELTEFYRSLWNGIFQSTPVVPTSTKRQSTYCGDLCKQTVHD